MTIAMEGRALGSAHTGHPIPEDATIPDVVLPTIEGDGREGHLDWEPPLTPGKFGQTVTTYPPMEASGTSVSYLVLSVSLEYIPRNWYSKRSEMKATRTFGPSVSNPADPRYSKLSSMVFETYTIEVGVQMSNDLWITIKHTITPFHGVFRETRYYNRMQQFADGEIIHQESTTHELMALSRPIDDSMMPTVTQLGSLGGGYVSTNDQTCLNLTEWGESYQNPYDPFIRYVNYWEDTFNQGEIDPELFFFPRLNNQVPW